MISALYRGHVAHKRFRPRVHQLAYRVFWTLLDLDDINILDKDIKCFSRNHFNLISFYDRDHFDGTHDDIRPFIETQLTRAGLTSSRWHISVLTMPRLLGYVFNPLSVWFCRDEHKELRAIIYEVSNTFGQRHSYLIRVSDPHVPLIEQKCSKEFFVSPFLDMDMDYHFMIKPPQDDVMIAIATHDKDGVMLTASLKGERAPLTTASLLQAVLSFPFQTLKVILGIHWEALFIWLKGALFHSCPPAPLSSITYVRPDAKDTP